MRAGQLRRRNAAVHDRNCTVASWHGCQSPHRQSTGHDIHFTPAEPASRIIRSAHEAAPGGENLTRYAASTSTFSGPRLSRGLINRVTLARQAPGKIRPE